LVPNDTNRIRDIFVHDRDTGETKRVSISSNGVEADAVSDRPGISGNGQFIAFESNATNLVPEYIFTGVYYSQVYVYNTHTNTIEMVSVDSNGNQGAFVSWGADLSYDGRFVAFASSSALVPEDDWSNHDVYVYDRYTRHYRE
jgi:hypothetical protein